MHGQGQSVYVLPAAALPGARAHVIGGSSSSSTLLAGRLQRGAAHQRIKDSMDASAAAQTARRVEARNEFAHRQRKHASRKQQLHQFQHKQQHTLQRPRADKNEDISGMCLTFSIEGKRAQPAPDTAARTGDAPAATAPATAAKTSAAQAAVAAAIPAAATEHDCLHAAHPTSLKSSPRHEARDSTRHSAAACRMLSAREALRAAAKPRAKARPPAAHAEAPAAHGAALAAHAAPQATAATKPQQNLHNTSSSCPVDPRSSIFDTDTPQHIVSRILSRVRRRVAAEMDNSISSGTSSRDSSSNPWGWQKHHTTSRNSSNSRRVPPHSRGSSTKKHLEKHSGAALMILSGSSSVSSSNSRSRDSRVNKSRHRRRERGHYRHCSRKGGRRRSSSSSIHSSSIHSSTNRIHSSSIQASHRKLGSNEGLPASLGLVGSSKARAENLTTARGTPLQQGVNKELLLSCRKSSNSSKSESLISQWLNFSSALLVEEELKWIPEQQYIGSPADVALGASVFSSVTGIATPAPAATAARRRDRRDTKLDCAALTCGEEDFILNSKPEEVIARIKRRLGILRSSSSSPNRSNSSNNSSSNRCSCCCRTRRSLCRKHRGNTACRYPPSVSRDTNRLLGETQDAENTSLFSGEANSRQQQQQGEHQQQLQHPVRPFPWLHGDRWPSSLTLSALEHSQEGNSRSNREQKQPKQRQQQQQLASGLTEKQPLAGSPSQLIDEWSAAVDAASDEAAAATAEGTLHLNDSLLFRLSPDSSCHPLSPSEFVPDASPSQQQLQQLQLLLQRRRRYSAEDLCALETDWPKEAQQQQQQHRTDTGVADEPIWQDRQKRNQHQHQTCRSVSAHATSQHIRQQRRTEGEAAGPQVGQNGREAQQQHQVERPQLMQQQQQQQNEDTTDLSYGSSFEDSGDEAAKNIRTQRNSEQQQQQTMAAAITEATQLETAEHSAATATPDLQRSQQHNDAAEFATQRWASAATAADIPALIESTGEQVATVGHSAVSGEAEEVAAGAVAAVTSEDPGAMGPAATATAAEAGANPAIEMGLTPQIPPSATPSAKSYAYAVDSVQFEIVGTGAVIQLPAVATTAEAAAAAPEAAETSEMQAPESNTVCTRDAAWPSAADASCPPSTCAAAAQPAQLDATAVPAAPASAAASQGPAGATSAPTAVESPAVATTDASAATPPADALIHPGSGVASSVAQRAFPRVAKGSAVTAAAADAVAAAAGAVTVPAATTGLHGAAAAAAPDGAADSAGAAPDDEAAARVASVAPPYAACVTAAGVPVRVAAATASTAAAADRAGGVDVPAVALPAPSAAYAAALPAPVAAVAAPGAAVVAPAATAAAPAATAAAPAATVAASTAALPASAAALAADAPGAADRIESCTGGLGTAISTAAATTPPPAAAEMSAAFAVPQLLHYPQEYVLPQLPLCSSSNIGSSFYCLQVPFAGQSVGAAAPTCVGCLQRQQLLQLHKHLQQPHHEQAQQPHQAQPVCLQVEHREPQQRSGGLSGSVRVPTMPTVETEAAQPQERTVLHREEVLGQRLLCALAKAVWPPSQKYRRGRRIRIHYGSINNNRSSSNRSSNEMHGKGENEFKIARRNTKTEKEDRNGKRDRGRKGRKYNKRSSSSSSGCNKIALPNVDKKTHYQCSSSSHRHVHQGPPYGNQAGAAVPPSKETYRREPLAGSTHRGKGRGNRVYDGEEKLARSIRLQQRTRLLRLLEQHLEMQHIRFTTAALFNA